jgi:hypothetical protein
LYILWIRIRGMFRFLHINMGNCVVFSTELCCIVGNKVAFNIDYSKEFIWFDYKLEGVNK